MDSTMIDAHLENIDRRLTKLEQILPTLGTKEELRLAVAPLATKEELRLAVSPLATKEELKALATKQELQLAIEPLATKEDLLGLRRHLTVLIENQNDKINLLIDFVHSLRPKRPGE
jgi:hypothetical protein